MIEDWLASQFLPVAVPFASAFAGVWLASQLAGRRSHSERVWLRKSDAYGKILEALADIRDWYAVYFDDILIDRETTAEQDDERKQLLIAAKRQLASTVSREVWHLPDAVKRQIEEMNHEFSIRQDSWQEHLDHCAFAAKNAQNEIEAIALFELKRPSLF